MISGLLKIHNFSFPISPILFLPFDPVTKASLDVYPFFVFKFDQHVNVLFLSRPCFANSIYLQKNIYIYMEIEKMLLLT